MVDGKMTRIPVGTEVKVTQEQADKHASKLVSTKDAKHLDEKGNLKPAAPASDSAALTGLQAELDAAVQAKADAEGALETTQGNLDAAEAAGAQLQSDLDAAIASKDAAETGLVQLQGELTKAQAEVKTLKAAAKKPAK
jgi:chromosome segregation ATPase